MLDLVVDANPYRNKMLLPQTVNIADFVSEVYFYTDWMDFYVV